MIRSEIQVALDDLQRACREAAELYDSDAELIDETPLAELFRDLGRQCAGLSDRLAEQQRALGDLPSGLDTDRETLVEFKDRLQAQLSTDEFRTLLEHRLGTERRLEGLVDHALGLEYPPPALELLQELRRHVVLAQRRLRSALGAV